MRTEIAEKRDPGLKSLSKAMLVLEGVNRGLQRVSTLQRKLGFSKTSILRILDTLVRDGFLCKAADGRYIATSRCLLLASGFDQYSFVKEAIVDYLSQVRSEIVWPLDVAVFENFAMRIVEIERPQGTMTMFATVGNRIPVLQSSLGRAYLSGCDPEESSRIIAFLGRGGEDRIGRSHQSIHDILAKARECGFALADRDYRKNITAIAAPIFLRGKAIGAVNMMFIASVLPVSRVIDEYGHRIKEIGRRITDILS